MLDATMNASDLNGDNGFAIFGIDAGDFSGYSLKAAGDVNRDGYDDVIIGAYGADGSGRTDAGESYVVFGKAQPFAPELEVAALNGINGFALRGVDEGDISGIVVSSAGDFNGDEFDDLLIAARQADPGGNPNAGENYVVFRKESGFAPIFQLSSLNGANGFVIDGIDRDDYSGYWSGAAGDVNGDGLDDVIIGAPYADPGGRFQAGEAYVVFGTSSGHSARFSLEDLDGRNGFVVNGIGGGPSNDIGDLFGDAVGTAGDFNGDGFDDLLIGAPAADPLGRMSAGESYIVFGFAESLQVVSVTVNGNETDPPDLPAGRQPTSWSLQRSDLRTIEVRFSTDVVAQAADFVLTNLGTNAPHDPAVNFALSDNHVLVAGDTVTIRFSKNELADGVYQLEILPAITTSTGVALDGNSDGTEGDFYLLTGDSDNRFFKLTADWDGDGGVTIFDFPAFAYWFGQTVPPAPEYMDLEPDGGISWYCRLKTVL